MKYFIKKLFWKAYLMGFFLLIQTINVFARTTLCSSCPEKINARIAVGAGLSQSKQLQTFDVSALNLKNNEQRVAQNTTAVVSISLANFNTISAVGNSWLLYQSSASFSMNIGTANNTSPQTWTLPTNLLTYFDGAGRSDFIATSSVPPALQVSGANKVMQTYYFDNNDRPMKVYDHYDINSSAINHLGTSYDLEVGDDDNFDEPDYEFSDVPLDLNDTFTSTIEEEDYVTNLTLTKFVETITADAYGTIATPNGTFNCLRLSIVSQKYTRPNESAAYTLVSTTNNVSFVTKEGVYFTTQVSATSGTATLSNFQYRRVVATASLSDPTDVRMNNDSKGVAINTDNHNAHPSAILDIKSSNMGVLIPRIAKANRPSSPATGLLVYQIDNTPGFYYYDGSGWRVLGSSPSARVAADESTQSGTGTLQNGSAFIKFDTPQENPDNVLIQLQLEGDAKGIFIANKTKDGFEVRELQGGKSNAKFNYTINKK